MYNRDTLELQPAHGRLWKWKQRFINSSRFFFSLVVLDPYSVHVKFQTDIRMTKGPMWCTSIFKGKMTPLKRAPQVLVERAEETDPLEKKAKKCELRRGKVRGDRFMMMMMLSSSESFTSSISHIGNIRKDFQQLLQ